MRTARATWDFLRGRIDEREFTMRICRHQWDPKTLRCTGLCGESIGDYWALSVVPPLVRAFAKLLPAAQRANRAFKAFAARMDA